jgi:AraC family transcriptional regulator
MSLQGHAAVKFVTGRRLASSSGRGWTNMLAERWSHAVGELPSILPRDTEIAVLLSGGTLVERQGPGLFCAVVQGDHGPEPLSVR